MPVPYCFNYYSFVIKFEIRKCDTCNSTLSQNCFGYLGSFVDSYTLKFVFSISVKNTIGIFIGITLNLQMTLGSIFMMFLFLQTILLFLQYPCKIYKFNHLIGYIYAYTRIYAHRHTHTPISADREAHSKVEIIIQEVQHLWGRRKGARIR